jgi:hypothetical protein
MDIERKNAIRLACWAALRITNIFLPFRASALSYKQIAPNAYVRPRTVRSDASSHTSCGDVLVPFWVKDPHCFPCLET